MITSGDSVEIYSLFKQCLELVWTYSKTAENSS